MTAKHISYILTLHYLFKKLKWDLLAKWNFVCQAGHSTKVVFLLHYFKLLLQSCGVIQTRKLLPFLVMWHKYTQWKLL